MKEHSNQQSSEKKYYALLLLVCALAVIGNMYWILTDTRPQGWDGAGHGHTALQYIHAIQGVDADPGSGIIGRVLDVYSWYPPLTYVAGIVSSFLVTPTMDRLTLSLNVFLILLILSVYFFAKKLYGPKAGILCAVVIATLPGILTEQHRFMLDLPLTATVAFTLAALAYTDGFANRRFTIVLGIAIGLGMLAKWTFPLFVIAPLLFDFFRGLKSGDHPKGVTVKNAVIALIVGAIVCSPYYLSLIPKLPVFMARTTQVVFANAGMEGDPSVLSLEAISYYMKVLFSHYLWAPLFFMAVIGIGMSFRKGKSKLPLIAFLGAYLLMTLIPNKEFRYILPILPSACVLIAGWVTSFSIRPLRLALFVFVAAYSSFNFLGLHGLLPFFPKAVNANSVTFYSFDDYLLPQKQNWQVNQILSDIQDRPVAHNKIRLAVLPDHEFFEWFAFNTEAAMMGVKLRQIPTSSFLNSEQAETALLGADFIVAKDGGEQGPEWTTKNTAKFMKQLTTPETHLNSSFEELRRYPLPDGSTAILYRADSSPAQVDLSQLDIENPADALFQNAIRFLGMNANVILQGNERQLRIQYFWQCEKGLDKDYRIFVHFENPKGFFSHDHFPQDGLAPTSTWQPGQMVMEKYSLPIPADVPGGTYRILLGVFEEVDGKAINLPVTGKNQFENDTRILAGEIIFPPIN